mmetsp:Transcript_30395/g.87252  ORF Transcript_30395/g.87252 Transcript_30395/m.87252 type:complete len:209 (+) Transcript_30395:844-1470(+)
MMMASSMFRSTSSTRNMYRMYHKKRISTGMPDGRRVTMVDFCVRRLYQPKSPMSTFRPVLMLPGKELNSSTSLPKSTWPIMVKGRKIVAKMMPKWAKSTVAWLKVSVTTLSRALAVKALKNFITMEIVLSAMTRWRPMYMYLSLANFDMTESSFAEPRPITSRFRSPSASSRHSRSSSRIDIQQPAQMTMLANPSTMLIQSTTFQNAQ